MLNIVKINFRSIRFIMIIALLMSFIACQTAKTQIETQSESAKEVSYPTPLAKNRKWIPGSYEGLELGKSTKSDAVKKFGKIHWEGDEPLEGTDEENKKVLKAYGGKLQIVEFDNPTGFKGRITVVVRKKDGIIQTIMIYPEKFYSKESVGKKYGNNYIELSEKALTPCSAIKGEHLITDRKEQVSNLWVYPEKGMWAVVNKKGEITYMGLSVICGVDYRQHP